jgi:phosphoglycerol transferase MdoB-like AlkP superfamily enzyme
VTGPEPARASRARLLHSRFGALAIIAAIFAAASLLTRLLLIALHPPETGPLPVLLALAAGCADDAIVAMWLTAPLALWLAALPERAHHTRAWYALLRLGLLASLALATFVAVAELLFFDEFDGRFNFVAVDYLIYPTEVTTNLWQSYPLGWLLAGIGALAALIGRALRRLFLATITSPTTRRQRLAVGGGYALALACLTIAGPRDLSRVSDDRALNEIAGNGYHAFWSALMGQDAPYEGLYATRPDTVVFARLQRLLEDSGAVASPLRAPSTERPVVPPGPERRLNVVVVLEESLGAEHVGVLRPRLVSLTPNLDSLARESVLFTRAYSTGNRTIRALEATTSSLPPLPGISIVRRPASVGLFTLPNVLRARGYSTAFIYGGRALFDGMGRFMRDNGMERVIDQGEMPEEAFTTAWGVADEYTFDRALAAMDSMRAGGRPFYALVLTVSNHKPYTYPAGRVTAPLPGRRRDNAVHYADWALGRFMRRARAHAWFDSTLFVLMGDHGARVYGAAEIPLASYEVPIVMHAPAILAPHVVPTLASSLDVPPTILGLLGVPYRSKFFGHDLLAATPGDGRALVTHNSEVALLRGDLAAVLGLHGATTLYHVDAASRRLTAEPDPDAAGRDLVEDAIAYFNGADLAYRSGAYRFDSAEATACARVVSRK